MVSGKTNAATMMIAEKPSDLLKADQRGYRFFAKNAINQ